MFCKNIINIELSSFDSSNVINMSYMFNECSNLEEIILNNLKANNVKYRIWLNRTPPLSPKISKFFGGGGVIICNLKKFFFNENF